MKETILSIAEKQFILRAASEGKRLDGRKLDECRKMDIIFGKDWGCCQVSLGHTKVLAQVSCEVQQPKPTRPNEGLLFLNVELSPMGAPHFEAGRQSELGVQLNRLLEKCIKDSQCVDLESLCIVAEEKVWALRVDINVLNHDGSLVDAASAAALTALCHFRRPDVTMTGEQITVHDMSERDPIPISMHHHPVCVTYAMFNKGEKVIADPTEIEERVSESQLVYGINAYRELCGLHLGGSALTTSDIVLQYSGHAANRAAQVVQQIKKSLEQDNTARAERKPLGFAESIRSGEVLALSLEELSLQLDTGRLRSEAIHNVSTSRPVNTDSKVVPLGDGSAELIPSISNIKIEDSKNRENSSSKLNGGVPASSFDDAGTPPAKRPSRSLLQDSKVSIKEEDDESSSISESSDIEVVQEISMEEKVKDVESIELSGDSEEEETMVLVGEDLESDKDKKTRNWYSPQKW